MQATVATLKARFGALWLLVMVAGLVVTIVAVSVPNLLRSRIAANESSAVGSVRTINTAITTYEAEHPDAGYPQTLLDLAPYVDPALANGEKSGYRFRYEAVDRDGDGVAEGFRLKATPVALGQSGQRIFSSNETGVISYQSSAGRPKEVLGGGGTLPEPDRRPAPQSRLMVRKGSVSLQVAEPAATAERIRAVAYRLDGYVESVRFSNEGVGGREASITIRLPASRYDEARREVRALGDRVKNEEDDARDVTGQYVDMESNLRNYHAEEVQYREIMKRAGSIKDTLAAAEKLADVRGRIERTQGQLNLLAHQTQMAVLEVSLSTEAVVQPVDVRWHPLAVIKSAFWDAADDLSTYANFMIAVVFRLPVFLLWVVTVLASGLYGWRFLRWLWKRLAPAPLPTT